MAFTSAGTVPNGNTIYLNSPAPTSGTPAAYIEGDIKSLMDSANFAFPAEWSSSATYSAGQLVSYYNFIYRAVDGSTDVAPGSDQTKWRILGGNNRVVFQGGWTTDSPAASQILYSFGAGEIQVGDTLEVTVIAGRPTPTTIDVSYAIAVNLTPKFSDSTTGGLLGQAYAPHSQYGSSQNRRNNFILNDDDTSGLFTATTVQFGSGDTSTLFSPIASNDIVVFSSTHAPTEAWDLYMTVNNFPTTPEGDNEWGLYITVLLQKSS